MAVSTTTLVNATQTRVDGITASCKNEDILLAAIAANRTACQDGHKKVTVATVNDLPSVETTGIGAGHMVFVESINVPVVSYAQGWMGLDRRVLRKDSPDRKLWVFGYNLNGMLGDNSSTNRNSPVTTAGGGLNWCSVAFGTFRSIAIKTDGTLWTSGSNDQGQLGIGETITTVVSSPVTIAGGGTTWCQVASQSCHTLAVKSDGTLWAWGSPTGYGFIGDGTTNGRSSPVTTAGGGTNWKQASTGCRHSLAVKSDGTLWAWGENIGGQIGNSSASNWFSSPVTTSGGGTTWCQVSGGCFHSAAIKTNGTLWTWGCNVGGVLGNGNITNYSSPVTTAGGGTNWCQVSIHSTHSMGIKTDGTLWVWGCSTGGKLGTGTAGLSSPLTTLGGGTTWCQISAGFLHSTAVKTDGTLWVWGCNCAGQLGDGTSGIGCTATSPVTTIAGGNSWCFVSAGVWSTGAITSQL